MPGISVLDPFRHPKTGVAEWSLLAEGGSLLATCGGQEQKSSSSVKSNRGTLIAVGFSLRSWRASSGCKA
jgi:hypothetical protein